MLRKTALRIQKASRSTRMGQIQHNFSHDLGKFWLWPEAWLGLVVLTAQQTEKVKKGYFFLSWEVKATLTKKKSLKYCGSRQGRRNLLYTPDRFHVFLNKEIPNWKEGMVTNFNINVIFSIFNRKFNFLVLENYQASSRCLLGEGVLLTQVSLCPMLPSIPRAKQLGLFPSVLGHCFLLWLNLERERETTKMREQVRIINTNSSLDLKISHIGTILIGFKIL